METKEGIPVNRNQCRKIHVVCVMVLGFFACMDSAEARRGAPAAPPKADGDAVRVDRESLITNGFITALARDDRGRPWVGTEDEGVWVLEGAGRDRKARQYTDKDGLGDNSAYALLCDRVGRIWVGHLNHGVSVFNGQAWKNYGVTEGPLGERVFALAASPVDGDVWIGTSGGLCRYGLATRVWTYYTRADGLPSDQIQALAFDPAGTLYVGTQCDGLAIGSAKDNYRQWRTVRAPEEFAPGVSIPLTGYGKGLPANQINCLMVGRNGTVWAGTTTGLAWSRDEGVSWAYIRGRDYVAKAEGLYEPGPHKVVDVGTNDTQRLLPEDYVTCLSQDSSGVLWVGFRTSGVAFMKGTSFRTVSAGARRYVLDCVASLLPDSTNMLVGAYRFGLVSVRAGHHIAPAGGATGMVSVVASGTGTVARLPAPAAAPTVSERRTMTQRVQSVRKEGPARPAAYLGDDWTTQGDWVGRYGIRRALLCAMNAPWCDHEFIGDFAYGIKGSLGPNKRKDDALRHWVHDFKTDNPRSLYSPEIGIRRQADWDDHGETYPMTLEGPDMWIAVTVPCGMHKLSLYFVNEGGKHRFNRFRDYLVEIRQDEGGAPPASADSVVEQTTAALTRLDKIRRQRPLARARVRDFCGGVYKSFAVKGPDTYLVRINRNGSYNTICSGVFLDALGPAEQAGSVFELMDMAGVKYDAPEIAEDEPARNSPLEWAMNVWKSTDEAWGFCGAEELQYGKRMAYRAAVSGQPPEGLAGNWKWHLRIWDAAERRKFTETMARAWAANQELRPYLKTRAWCPYSPGVMAETEDELEKRGAVAGK